MLSNRTKESARTLWVLRVGSFESPVLLLAGDRAPEPASGRPKPGPTTQNKPCELGLKARTTCFVLTSNKNPTKVSEMHFDLDAGFQEKAPFLGSAHQIVHSIQKNRPFLGSIHHLQSPILIQVLFQVIRMIFTYILDTQ